MKNLLKMSLLGIGIAMGITACGDGKKAPDTIDTAQVDSSKTDASAVKPDTLHADSLKKLHTDSVKK
jgi:hypothetical protein